jgi:hypothetical protein
MNVPQLRSLDHSELSVFLTSDWVGLCGFRVHNLANWLAKDALRTMHSSQVGLRSLDHRTTTVRDPALAILKLKGCKTLVPSWINIRVRRTRNSIVSPIHTRVPLTGSHCLSLHNSNRKSNYRELYNSLIRIPHSSPLGCFLSYANHPKWDPAYVLISVRSSVCNLIVPLNDVVVVPRFGPRECTWI